MLVLTRRSGESIVIGNDVVVTVLEVRSDQVRIGIVAPRSVQVHREEVFRQLARENTAAVASVERARALIGRSPPVRPTQPEPPAAPSERPAAPPRRPNPPPPSPDTPSHP